MHRTEPSSFSMTKCISRYPNQFPIINQSDDLGLRRIQSVREIKSDESRNQSATKLGARIGAILTVTLVRFKRLRIVQILYFGNFWIYSILTFFMVTFFLYQSAEIALTSPTSMNCTICQWI
jgi:hypothetical protein